MNGKKYGRYIRLPEMTWPAVCDEEISETVWRLQYGTPTKEDLSFAAGTITAYRNLVNKTNQRRNEICNAIKNAERKPADAEEKV